MDIPSNPSAADVWQVNPMHWLAAIVDSSDDAIIGKTLDSIVRSWNGGATRIFGYTADEMVGRSIVTLMPPDRQHEEPAIVARLSRGERVDHYETVRMRKDGALIDVSISVSPIRDDAGRIVGAAKIARDVSEEHRLRRAERVLSEQLQEQAIELEQQAAELEQQVDEAQSLQEELEQTNDELHRSLEVARTAQDAAEEANRAKSAFVATMSHELRTPLNAIAGYVDLMEMGIRGALTSAQQADLGRIKQNQQTLLRLIEDVLDFAKIESGRVEFDVAEVPLDELLHTLEVFIAPTLQRKQIEYQFEPCGGGAVALADRGKVEQILLNLLSNAAKFIQSGRIEVRCVVQDRSLEVRVTDTGPGIRPELLDKIFEPFIQADQQLTRTAEGTGLGLSISRQLARGMRGDVVVSSVVGRGSTFALLLPRAQPGNGLAQAQR